jgi:hypothetical protein
MVPCGPYPAAGPRGPLDRIAQIAERQHCRPQTRPLRRLIGLSLRPRLLVRGYRIRGDAYCASQRISAAYVGCGSVTSISLCPRYVRFVRKMGHRLQGVYSGRLLGATLRHNGLLLVRSLSFCQECCSAPCYILRRINKATDTVEKTALAFL